MTARRRNWLLIFVVLVFIVVLRTFSGPERAETDYFATRTPQVIAHQGGNLLRPGNTLAAFEHAVALGADVLEFDVHLTADRELAIIHDATLDRTTNGAGAVGAAGAPAVFKGIVGAGGAGGAGAAPEVGAGGGVGAPAEAGSALRVTRTVSFFKETAEVFFIGIGGGGGAGPRLAWTKTFCEILLT